MKCPYCKEFETKVIDSRYNSEENHVKRRRECIKCKKRFNTSEKITRIAIYVKKSNGKIEEFDREKVYKGLKRALIKRDYDINKLENLVDDIENEVLNYKMNKIPSKEVGQIIMNHLLKFDEVAYIRFASVYNKFETLDSFMKKIKEVRLKKQKECNKK